MTRELVSSTNASSGTSWVYTAHTGYRSLPSARPLPISSTVTGSSEIENATDESGSAHVYEETFRLKGQLPGGRVLLQELPVTVTAEMGEFVATQFALDISGFGQSPIDAIIDFVEALVDHIEVLESAGEKVAAHLARQRESMRALITARNA